MFLSEHPLIICDSQNIASKFVIHATHFPDDIAIVEDGTCVTYGWLLRHAHALAVHLRSEHQPGAVVAIHGRRNVDTPLAMIACLLANITFVVIDAAYVQQRILDILMLSGARTLLHAELGEELRRAIAASGISACPIRRGS
jgi:acyl-CoA synthetase (AMP-forming)/AMP-acid ligase II